MVSKEREIKMEKENIESNNKENKKKKTVLAEPKGGFKFLGVMLAMFLVLSLFYLFICGQLKYYFSPAGVRLYLQNNEYIEDMLEEFLSDTMYMDYPEDYFSEEEMQEIKEFFYSAEENMMQYFVTGEGDIINVDELMDYAHLHKSQLEEMYGYDIEKEDFEYMKEDLEYYNEEAKELLQDQAEYLDEPMATLYPYLKTLTSSANLLITIIAIVASILIIGVMFGKRIDKTMIYTAVATTVSSVLMLLLSGFIKALAIVSLEGDMLLDIYIEEEMIPLVDVIANKGIMIATSVLVVAIILNILGHMNRKQQIKQSVNA